MACSTASMARARMALAMRCWSAFLAGAKVASFVPVWLFTRDVKKIMAADSLPVYRVALDTSKKPAHVVFFTRDWRTLAERLEAENRFEWFEKLKKSSTPPAKKEK